MSVKPGGILEDIELDYVFFVQASNSPMDEMI